LIFFWGTQEERRKVTRSTKTTLFAGNSGNDIIYSYDLTGKGMLFFDIRKAGEGPDFRLDDLRFLIEFFDCRFTIGAANRKS
jgi:hypothetical protein